MDIYRVPSMSLLVYLTCVSGCNYLSDLRFLHCRERAKLAKEISKIPTAAAALWEWNDALVYLVDKAPCHSAAVAKRKLVELLSGSEISELDV